MGREAMEGLRFLASLPLAGTGKEEDSAASTNGSFPIYTLYRLHCYRIRRKIG